MVSALGIDVQRSFAIGFALGALLAGLCSLIVGRMGSIVGTASGAVLIGLVEQWSRPCFA
jgi:branched-subunit amino acid ABC-type transport system permease component